MKTDWNYTELALSYVKRPDYSAQVIDEILLRSSPHTRVCDVGAGVGHLSRPLAERGCRVTAVEPNDAMRQLGSSRLAGLTNIEWVEATGEETLQPSGHFDLTTFGSSFNVVNQAKALAEVHRITRRGGTFACLWNHRDLNDNIQKQIEHSIRELIPEYEYGSRREDPTEGLTSSGYFSSVEKIEGTILHNMMVDDCVEAWKSHATLQRQAGTRIKQVLLRIEDLLKSLKTNSITIPYTTRCWVATLKTEIF